MRPSTFATAVKIWKEENGIHHYGRSPFTQVFKLRKRLGAGNKLFSLSKKLFTPNEFTKCYVTAGRGFWGKALFLGFRVKRFILTFGTILRYCVHP